MINQIDIRTFKSFPQFKERFLLALPKNYQDERMIDSCWIWKESNKCHCGLICYGNIQYPAPRISYITFKGPIKPEQIVRHTCDTPRCVNPKHLILGTHHDNSIDSIKRNRGAHQKLTQEEVIEIKTALKKPYHGIQKELAEKHNVSPCTISGIKCNNSWHWITI